MRWLVVAIALLVLPLPSIAQLDEETAYDEVVGVVKSSFNEVLRKYDEAVAADPENIQLRLRRCSVINNFVYLEEFHVEAAQDLDGTCLDDLEVDFPEHPAIELARISNLYGQDVVDRSDALHDTPMEYWTAAQHAELHVKAANSAMWLEDGSFGYHCMRAMELDLGADCRVGAAQWYWERDRHEKAINLLTSPIDQNREHHHLFQKLQKLAEFEAWEGFRDVYALLPTNLSDHQRVSIAEFLIQAEEYNDAAAMLDTVSDGYWDSSALAFARLELARASGDGDQVIEYYNQIRDADYWNDPFLGLRLGIAFEYPGLPWKLRDFIGVFATIMVVAFAAAIAAIIPAGVHYRGLVRRTRDIAAGLSDSLWTLRNAWYAIFVVLFADLMSMYLFDYKGLVWLISPEGYGEYIEEGLRYDLMIISMTVISLLMIWPLVFTKSRWRSWLIGEWPIGKTIGIAIGIAILARLLFAMYAILVPADWSLAQVSTTIEGVIQINENYGSLATVALLALVVPLAEETIFRGILLQGFARHISFSGANWIQALMFASVHEEIAFFPLYVAFGLVAGKLSQRSGSLLCAIVMHSIFNLAAAWAIIAVVG